MTAAPPLKLQVLLADDSGVVRERLQALLAEEPELRVVAEAQSTAQTIRLFEIHRPDAVVLDLHFGDGTGVEALRRIKQSAPHCAVIVLTNLDEPVFREICLTLGADAFLHKASEFDKLAGLLKEFARKRPAPVDADSE